MGQRSIIIANGEITNYSWHRSLIREDDFIVCADGGARHALAMGIVPHVVLGDFDSLSPSMKADLLKTNCRVESFPAEKDATDTELALKWCLKQNPQEIIILGALGTRFDHSLASIFLLALVPVGIPARLVNEQNEIFLVRDHMPIEGSPGEYVSVLPLTPGAFGVFTKGLKYILHDEALDFGTTRGVANELVKEKASLEIKEGWALVIKAWDSPR
ncbi:MAG: thiamine diphosphokinase [Bacillota bacterium]|jgi:thiamine pyrophosphokinase|nr:thiamine diphosphokinase [Clostridia bacterium]